MKLVTRDTDYALRALCYIAAHKDTMMPAGGLVAALDIPRPFLRKILQTLNRNGLLKSYKGQGGGFMLAKPAERIFLLDLIKVFQGPFKLNECLFKREACPNTKKCVLKQRLDRIEEHVLRELKNITIASLLRKH
ncbi:MAG: Rrf2 family transcriptional regulator [Candidatus Omnitrophica bacterium]|nr:Rrf2 family transcriptional regulator [Candidatus Omnitrophota bacterium]